MLHKMSLMTMAKGITHRTDPWGMLLSCVHEGDRTIISQTQHNVRHELGLQDWKGVICTRIHR